MIYPLEQVKEQISKTDQQLMYHLILEQQETNRLLRKLVGGKGETDPSNDIETLKRPELMKRMAKLKNKPQGWNTWDNEEIIKHLKGVSA